ncbi:MAG: CvpA family protein [Muribaculaceae bacterium]|nr:CvpA family protein [Muribaculaceae bacterium]
MLANVIYLLLVLAVALVSLAGGFRHGITRQLASLLGFAFGAVAARVLTPEFVGSFQWAGRLSQAEEFKDLTTDLLCAATIYFVVYWLFSLLSPIFRWAMAAIETGIFNRLLGAFFSMVKNLLWLSICLNILLCLQTESGLIRYEKANDGNPVAAVMAMTPAILGCYGAEDFAHFHQLREAKKISCRDPLPCRNIPGKRNVIIEEYTLLG